MDQTRATADVRPVPPPPPWTQPQALPRRAPLVDGLLLGLAALLVYLALGQTQLWKSDGHFILRRLLAGEAGFYHHFLYMPGLMAFRAALGWLGVELAPHRLATAFAALGTAAGIVLVHAVCRRAGLRRTDAALATALVATAPAVLFFATIVEFHGTFFPFAVLAFLATLALEQRPTRARAALAGAASGLAFAVHASGVLLPVLLAAWFLAAGPLDRRRLGHVAVLMATHAVVCWGLANAALTLGFGTFPRPADTAALGRLLSLERWRALPAVAWREVIGPYLPLSLTWAVALLVRAGDAAPLLRRRALALVAGMLPFLLLSMVLIPLGQTERGAYLLPCAVPAALLTVAVLPRSLLLVVLAVGAGLGVAGVRLQDDGGATYRRFADAVADAADGRPCMLLIASEDELGACVVMMPQQQYWLLTELAVVDPALVQQSLPLLQQALRQYWQRGQRVLLSEWATAYLLDPANSRSGPLLMGYLRRACRLQDKGARRLGMFEVLPLQ